MDWEENKEGVSNQNPEPEDSEMTEQNWDDDYGNEEPVTSLKKAASITDKVIQTDPTKKNSSYMFMTQDEVFTL